MCHSATFHLLVHWIARLGNVHMVHPILCIFKHLYRPYCWPQTTRLNVCFACLVWVANKQLAKVQLPDTACVVVNSWSSRRKIKHWELFIKVIALSAIRFHSYQWLSVFMAIMGLFIDDLWVSMCVVHNLLLFNLSVRYPSNCSLFRTLIATSQQSIQTFAAA